MAPFLYELSLMKDGVDVTNVSLAAPMRQVSIVSQMFEKSKNFCIRSTSASFAPSTLGERDLSLLRIASADGWLVAERIGIPVYS